MACPWGRVYLSFVSSGCWGYFDIKHFLHSVELSMIHIRQYHDCSIFLTGIPQSGKTQDQRVSAKIYLNPVHWQGCYAFLSLTHQLMKWSWCCSFAVSLWFTCYHVIWNCGVLVIVRDVKYFILVKNTSCTSTEHNGGAFCEWLNDMLKYHFHDISKIFDKFHISLKLQWSL